MARKIQKFAQKHKDELIKIAGNLASFERFRENEAYLCLDFYKFIRKHIVASLRRRSTCKVANFFLKLFLFGKEKV